MEAYRLTAEEALAAAGSTQQGLSAAEAERRLQKNGRNVLSEGKKRSKLLLFLAQFCDLMTGVLILAAALSAGLAVATGDRAELVDTAILLFVVLMNAAVGFFQQYRADTAIEKLRKLSAAEAKVVRGGRIVRIDAEELVVGDVVELAEGDRVPADCRVLSSEALACDESMLTGESKPVGKADCTVAKAAVSAHANMVHAGTFCVRGSARALVTACGMETEMGRIAALLKDGRSAPAPLDATIAKLGRIVTAAVLFVALALFAGLLLGRHTLLESLMRAVAVAVAAIPEGMGAVVTVILALGVQRMASSRAVMRRLGAAETLGGCTVICSDKTGTLTRNKMTVEAVAVYPYMHDQTYAPTPARQALLRCMRICHTVKGSAGGYLGDPTEVALLEYADAVGFHFAAQRCGGTPFSSERKRMSVLARTEEGTKLYVKGGADVLLKRCTRILTDTGEREMTAEDRRRISACCARFADGAMRVLGFACGQDEREEDLAFAGLAAMLDPPKEGVGEAVAACRRAGVRTVMITGDSPETAYAIAVRLGIAKGRGEVATGDELDAMDEAALRQRAARTSVYARVSPGHKQRIVRALQAAGEVVAMTGDGVNDAPALKSADVGVAMGSGTDVTKDAADVVLADDNFATMVRAVEEGRNIFFNIKKTVSFFLSTNFAEVLSVFFVTLFLWQQEFLTSTQLLWINLITDSLPVIALGTERTAGAMERPPVSEREIFSRRAIAGMLFFGVVLSLLAVTEYLVFLRLYGSAPAMTAAFLTISLSELFHGLNVRAEGTRMTAKRFFSGRAMWLTIAAGVALNAALLLLPALRAAFRLTALTPLQWLLVALFSLAVLPLGALYRAVTARIRLPKRRRSGIPARGTSR